MYLLQVILSTSIILAAVYQGLTIHKVVVRSFYRNKILLRAISRILHEPKNENLYTSSWKGQVVLKIKSKVEDSNIVKITNKKHKFNYRFEGFLFHEK